MGRDGKVQHNAKNLPAHPLRRKDVAELEHCICCRVTKVLLKEVRGGGCLPSERHIRIKYLGWSFEHDFTVT